MVNIIVEASPTIYQCCDTLITAEDVASAVRFQNERRRSEHLAWRRIVRRELGRNISISYNDVGTPVVDTPNRWISVAHSAGYVAVAIADRAIGIDIESSERDFEYAKGRFMSQAEIALSDDRLWAGYVWIAKEAMYKLYGVRGIELRDELHIESFDPHTKTLRGSLVGNANKALVQISHKEESMMVAVATYE